MHKVLRSETGTLQEKWTGKKMFEDNSSFDNTAPTRSDLTSMRHLFGQYFAERNLRQLTQIDIEGYLLYLAEQRHYSFSGLNLMVNAIKFLFEKAWHLP
jgi:hypothetical protein